MERPWVGATVFPMGKCRLYEGEQYNVVALPTQKYFKYGFTKFEMEEFLHNPTLFYETLQRILLLHFPVCPKLRMRNYGVNFFDFVLFYLFIYC